MMKSEILLVLISILALVNGTRYKLDLANTDYREVSNDRSVSFKKGDELRIIYNTDESNFFWKHSTAQKTKGGNTVYEILSDKVEELKGEDYKGGSEKYQREVLLKMIDSGTDYFEILFIDI